jgi:hypothetical protein
LPIDDDDVVTVAKFETGMVVGIAPLMNIGGTDRFPVGGIGGASRAIDVMKWRYARACYTTAFSSA